MLALNVGCGATATPGWMNFDNSLSVRLARTPLAALLPSNQRSFAEIVMRQGIRWADATKLPLGDGTVDVIYSSHMLEHMSKVQADSFLREALRVLKVGGILRLALPDLRVLTQEYLATGDADRFMERSLLSNPLDTLGDRLTALVVGTRHHQWMYDGSSLTAALTRQGFRNVVVLAAGETTIPDPGALDLRERETESVYVEGSK